MNITNTNELRALAEEIANAENKGSGWWVVKAGELAHAVLALVPDVVASQSASLDGEPTA